MGTCVRSRPADRARATGFAEYDDLIKEPTFRDFVCMYIGEGYNAIAMWFSCATQT